MDNLNKHQILFNAVSFIGAIVNLNLKNINYELSSRNVPKREKKVC